MAFNWQTFRTRSLTAVVFTVVMLTGLLWNHWSFLALFSIIHFGCWWEYLRLIEKIRRVNFHPYVKMGLMVIGYGLLLRFCGQVYAINGYGLRDNLSLPVSAAGFTLLVIGIFQKTAVKIKSLGIAALGLVYISVSWGLIVDLYRGYDIRIHDTMYVFEGYYFVPLFIVVSIWINDTMAYIVGSLIGKTPLSKISPKKTWEGTLGGILLSMAVAGIVAFYGLSYGILTIHIVTIAAIAAITGTFGDLLESKLKRMADVKDSGSLMPGHGGFLDRFDSLLIATPCVWIYIAIFMS